ncbi:MAG: aspartate aminotransferase family protein [Bdellovibrionota bacterium]|nr:MAG: aspartate aminotransferase family protein [Bdellovibrionota bacterium]
MNAPQDRLAILDAHMMTTYARSPVVFVRGSGCTLWDDQGNPYLDLVAGIATCSLGHAHPVIVEALAEQSKRLIHLSNLYYSEPQAALAAWLTAHSAGDRAFFCNSGAEANEGALKLVRKYSHRIDGHKTPMVITAEQSFHGRTLATVTATGQTKYQQGFDPLMPGFEHVSLNDCAALSERVAAIAASPSARLAAIMLEPVQGEGGVTPASKDFLSCARRLCDQHDALLVFDEIQCGMGRTGSLWAYEQLGVEPDIFTSAKGLGGGVPVAALLAKEHCSIFGPGDHGSTFGGNPLACHVALAVCQVIGSAQFLTAVTERGNELRAGLLDLCRQFPALYSGVRGKGLLLGVTIRDDVPVTSKEVVQAAFRERLLVIGAGPKVIRIVPPLIISSMDIQDALARLSAASAALSATTT